MAFPGAIDRLAIDVNALAQTRLLAKQDPQAAMKQAAQQFEALFLQMVLKAMREASPAEGIFDNEQSRLYQSLLDQQWAQTLSARGGAGLAALIEKQLARSQDAPLSPAAAGERAGVRGQDVRRHPLLRPSHRQAGKGRASRRRRRARSSTACGRMPSRPAA